MEHDGVTSMTQMRLERGQLMGHGGVRLSIAEWRAEDGPAPKALVILVHGYAEHVGRYAHVLEELVARGYAVFTLDHRGHGESAGRRASVARFDHFVDDLHLLVRRAREAYPPLPVFLLGHSMGGLIAIRYALRPDHQADLAGLVLSGAALQVGDDVSPLLKRLGAVLAAVVPNLPIVPRRSGILSVDPEVERRFKADPLCYNGRIRARLAHEILRAGADARARLDQLTLPLLAMHGTDDRLTNPAGSRLLVERARSSDKTLKLWPGHRHEIFNEPGRAAVIACVTDWLDARVPRTRAATGNAGAA